MLYSIHTADLASSMPRMLPLPLVTGILHLQAGMPLEDDVADFINRNGGNAMSANHRWYMEIMDMGVGGHIAAQGSFIRDDGQMVTEAMVVDPDYAGANIGPYLQGLAERLFGLGNNSTI